MTTTVPKRCGDWLNKPLKSSEMKLFLNLKCCNTVFWLIFEKADNENFLNGHSGVSVKVLAG